MTPIRTLQKLWSGFHALPHDITRRRRNAARVREAAKRGGEGGLERPTALPNGFSWERAGRIGLGVAASALLTALLCLHLWPNRVALRVGDIATTDIIAQRTVRYEDTDATTELRQAALQTVGRRYGVLPDAPRLAAETANIVFDIVDRWATYPADNVPIDAETGVNTVRLQSALDDIYRQGAGAVRKETVATLFRFSAPERAQAKATAADLLTKLMARSIKDDNDDLQNARADVAKSEELRGVFPDAKHRAAIAEIVAASLLPTQRFDAGATRAAERLAQGAVPAQWRRVAAGEPVIRAGERVTTAELDAFAALGLQNPRLDAIAVAIIGAMVTGMVAFVSVYLRLFHGKIYRSTPTLLLLAIQMVLAVAGLKIGSLLLGLPFTGVHFGYLGMMCVASAGMAIALLVDAGVATLLVALLSIASGMILNNELRYTLLTLGSSLIGIVSVATLKSRSDYLRATLILCGANAVLNALVGLLEGNGEREILSAVIWGGISGLFAMALFYTGVAIFERWFGITTHLRLLELSDPASPVLQEFRLQAPGSYAHSLMVGNLAHAAADSIGADSLLCRVAAYYHDLGKMNRPEFFIENQSGLENAHDRIAPSLSALVLAAHVKDGVEMCRALGFAPRVLEMIEQHHGTTLMKFFFYRAAAGKPNPAMESQFRYPGPKPQTKESAILLLADSVEAASRSLDKPTPARIAAFVAAIVEEKRADDQLDECNLTLREIKMVQESFVRTLSGALHARIAYPSDRKAIVETVPGLPEAADMPTPTVSFAPKPATPILVEQAPPGAFVPTVTTLPDFDEPHYGEVRFEEPTHEHRMDNEGGAARDAGYNPRRRRGKTPPRTE
ncbi:MAG: HDIG domain-containing protein [Armatimonadetes bacterium]|nr:HDIG domain-containing protein [Armatimonadota bacterium]